MTAKNNEKMAVNVQQLQPELVKSVTEDEDESQDDVMMREDQESIDRQAIAYLLRYETMVRQQEAEDMATLAHIRPILEHVQGISKLGFSMPDHSRYPELLEQEVTYSQLRQIVDEIERNPPPFSTDRQLMMVLRTLTRKAPESEDQCLTWAEFLQCYKAVVGGMQTLEHLSAQDLRLRARDRTLSILSLFDPPSTSLLDAEDANRSLPDSALTDSKRTLTIPFRRARRRLRAVLLLVFLALIGTLYAFKDDTEIAVQHLVRLGREYAIKYATDIETDLPVEQADPSPADFPLTEILESNESDMCLETDTVPLQEAPLEPEAALQVILTDHSHLIKPILRKRTTVAAVISGGAGVAAAPVLFHAASLAPVAAKTALSLLPAAGASAMAAAAVGSIVIFQVLTRGIGALLKSMKKSNGER